MKDGKLTKYYNNHTIVEEPDGTNERIVRVFPEHFLGYEHISETNFDKTTGLYKTVFTNITSSIEFI